MNACKLSVFLKDSKFIKCGDIMKQPKTQEAFILAVSWLGFESNKYKKDTEKSVRQKLDH